MAGWTLADHQKHWQAKRGSVGRANPGAQLRVVDDAGNPLGSDQPGLLEVKLSGGDYLIAGKDVTGFSWAEEVKFGVEDAVPYNLEEELQKRGAKYGKAWMAFSSHVVEDGKLITGQNPASAEGVGEAVVKRLKPGV